jgi:hypothetical protein
MDRKWKSGASGAPPSSSDNASTGYATAGNPGTGVPATKPGPWWYHIITEEIRAVIVAAGITPDIANAGQLLEALQSVGLLGGGYSSWTPTITGATSASGVTYTHQVGRYAKVGRIVRVDGFIELSSAGTIVGDLRLGGLPFAANPDVHGAINMTVWQGLTITPVYLVARVPPSTQYGELFYTAVAAAGALQPADITNVFNIYFSGSYLAAA